MGNVGPGPQGSSADSLAHVPHLRNQEQPAPLPATQRGGPSLWRFPATRQFSVWAPLLVTCITPNVRPHGRSPPDILCPERPHGSISPYFICPIPEARPELTVPPQRPIPQRPSPIPQVGDDTERQMPQTGARAVGLRAVGKGATRDPCHRGEAEAAARSAAPPGPRTAFSRSPGARDWPGLGERGHGLGIRGAHLLRTEDLSDCEHGSETHGGAALARQGCVPLSDPRLRRNTSRALSFILTMAREEPLRL
ncbi:PREDICTED: uncharacterized protein LOC105510414 [Colobus angolensis palliatus]|uniref:uncharacterized protein LOC105510414 n=1 Tax=Colobus angolensis palliatus TaxID=336983 RepID=UPI0005F42D7E|nr:PREDICTED: uncharacterized protein LOC105510414 [Colobus angolensis palliatus]